MLKCMFCPDKSDHDETMDGKEFVHNNLWVMNFWTIQNQAETLVDHPVCPTCAAEHLRQDNAEYLLVADFGGFPSHNQE